jgi:hypothetical protein
MKKNKDILENLEQTEKLRLDNIKFNDKINDLYSIIETQHDLPFTVKKFHLLQERNDELTDQNENLKHVEKKLKKQSSL